MMTIEEAMIAATEKYGVTVVDIYSASKTRAVCNARFFVWAKLYTRWPGGPYPSTRLAEIFDRTTASILNGIEKYEAGLKDARMGRRKRRKRRNSRRTRR